MQALLARAVVVFDTLVALSSLPQASMSVPLWPRRLKARHQGAALASRVLLLSHQVTQGKTLLPLECRGVDSRLHCPD